MIHSKKSFEGYIIIDHTSSPGTVNIPAGTIKEAAVLVCCHCNSTVILNKNRTRDRHWCSKCNQYVCDNQFCIENCRNFQQSLDAAQEKAFKNLNVKEI